MRLDEDFLHTHFNTDLLMDYCSLTQNQALDHRVKLFLKIYDL